MTNEVSGTDNEEGRSCPQCGEQLTKVGTFWVCPTHGQVPEPRPFTALRIFLSYGHDANEPLVRRIKTDLEKLGHDVWFDKNDIRPGDNWRRSITEGILHCDRFLSFLSKHSTRDPGVCRDEIAISIGVKDGNIQTILVESEAEVQPPVSISQVQWLDMHDWKAGHGIVQTANGQPATGDAAWESWYQGKLDEIRRIVESEQSRQFAGEIERLNEYLKPIKSHARIKQLLEKGFFGRAWLFDAIEKWRTASREVSPDKGGTSGSRLFWITGDPGVGKSAFAAQLTHTRSDAVIAAQFVEWDKPDHRSARRVVRSLAFQLATRLPDYRKLLLTLPEIAELDRKDPAELFDYLLANPLRSVIGGGRNRYLIVIDALDEAGEAGRNPLVEMLARHAPRLPAWLGFVVTSRPESAVQTPLQGLNPFVLDTRTEANRADLGDYLCHELAPQLRSRQDADRLVEQILEKSEGVFLYVEHFCDDVQQNHLSLDHPDQFPHGLDGILSQCFRRLYPKLEEFCRDLRPMLHTMLAAREPLPVGVFQRLFDWRDRTLAAPVANEDKELNRHMSDIATCVWRIRRTLEGSDSSEARKAKRHVESMWDVLQQAGVVIEDVTGQACDSSAEIEVVAYEPAESAAHQQFVKYMVTPTIKHGGRVIQRGKAVVGYGSDPVPTGNVGSASPPARKLPDEATKRLDKDRPTRTKNDRVQFAVTSPPCVPLGQHFIVDVWAHTERQRGEVERRIQQAHQQTDTSPVIRPKGPFKIERGTTLFVRLQFQGLHVDSPEDVILWEGEIGNASFEVAIPSETTEGVKCGLVTVHWEGGLQIARIPLQVFVAANAALSAPTAQPLHHIRRAFASYASPDRDEVIGRIQGMQKIAPDLDVFLDVVKLRSGERWEHKLWQVIPENDVFYLFWSAAAKASPWVEKEWRCALNSRGEEFIDPVPLVSPDDVPPPDELSKKHFNDWILAYRRGRPKPSE